MKEERRGNITEEERRLLPGQAMEQVLDTRQNDDIGADSQDNLESDEERYPNGGDGVLREGSRSPLRVARAPSPDSACTLEGTGQPFVDGLTGHTTSWADTSEDDTSQQTMEKWALDNAPPPIKVRREGETSEESSPKELSPPPSPKRMRELSRKDHIHDLPFSKIFSHGSI